jgi:hypothetical protein
MIKFLARIAVVLGFVPMFVLSGVTLLLEDGFAILLDLAAFPSKMKKDSGKAFDVTDYNP